MTLTFSSLNVVFDYFSHSCPKMCEICLERTLDTTFLDCLALTFCDVIGSLLPEWACLTLQGGTTFLPTSKLADIPVSRVRKLYPIDIWREKQWRPVGRHFQWCRKVSDRRIWLSKFHSDWQKIDISASYFNVQTFLQDNKGNDCWCKVKEEVQTNILIPNSLTFVRD